MNVKQLFIFLFFSLSLQAFAAQALPEHLPLDTIDGKQIDLSTYKGKRPVYLKFWASWCADCIQQMPHLEALQKKYQGKIEIIAINLGVNDDAVSVAQVVKKYGLSMPVAIDKDGALAQQFDLMATPYHILIDREGRVVYKGYVDTKPVDQALQQMQFHGGSPTASKNGDVATAMKPIAAPRKGLQAVYYFATWCDWYFKTLRPQMSRQCISSQNLVNRLQAHDNSITWKGVATRLWTKDEEVKEYAKKFKVRYPLEIDTTNQQIFGNKIRTFPTLVVYEDGKEIYRTTDFDTAKMCAFRTGFCQESRSGEAQGSPTRTSGNPGNTGTNQPALP